MSARTRHPLPEVYADSIDFSCPNCGAKPGDWCVNEAANRWHGDESLPKWRIAPCVARGKAKP